MFLRSAVISVILLLSPLAMAEETKAPPLSSILEKAEALKPLRTVVVAHRGKIIAEHGYRGYTSKDPTSIMSASKSIISALVGIAIDKGILEGTDQKIATILSDDMPENADPRLSQITIGNLLSMQAGLRSTSGEEYGAWIESSNWVRTVLSQPFEDNPGGGMIYSTGSSHLLSAILTKKTGRSTRALANEWLGPVEGFRISWWSRDPQGIYVGGNMMAMSPRSLLAFGELYRTGGITPEGKRLISKDWIDKSWRPRTNSRYTGDSYGYGWFMRQITGEEVHFGWGYGGQMLYIVPRLELTVVMTSDEGSSAARSGHRDDLHALLAEVIDAARATEGKKDGDTN
ncbi:serine hydrolase [Rhizobium sp. TH2]|uniref:serine hydrolase domain-containing protein n=1 Tax=Rhizobium sp. TH2 TaxID=2775403 RepID=UPI002158888B|nr:serine hydrolase [Rhizobium sp. TH2]UVC07424.1 serine hydrolase [Rhizobium sp. TH2]